MKANYFVTFFLGTILSVALETHGQLHVGANGQQVVGIGGLSNFQQPQAIPSSNIAPILPLESVGPNSGVPNTLTPLSVIKIGQSCSDNFTCSGIANSHCVHTNRTCQCLPNFVEDTVFIGTCRLAPGYNEVCKLGNDIQCRSPFHCNKSGLCDCPDGFIQEFFQCIKDCPTGHIPIGDKCFVSKKLDETCEKHEQCSQTYTQCLHNKCQCIQGANQISGQCVPVSQCPIGDPLKDSKNKLAKCTSEESVESADCPSDYYCLQADASEPVGFCCPKIKINCPIGQPLEGHNCTSCPWETHHCFSYVIGRYTDTMCCPNACPTSHPIQRDGKCHARSAFNGHCTVDDQCFNVLNAVCRKTQSSNQTKCLCPEGNYNFYFGRCVKESGLGDECESNEECKIGTGTKCINHVCSCVEGQVPEPVKNPAIETPHKCVGEPTCPSVHGRHKVQTFMDCSFDSDLCKSTEACTSWWITGNTTYSLCCPKPTLQDYQAICTPYNMKVAIVEDGPRRCDILPFTQNFFLNDAVKRAETARTCAVGSSCLFDPFHVNKGVCCEPELNIEPTRQIFETSSNGPTSSSKTSTDKETSRSVTQLSVTTSTLDAIPTTTDKITNELAKKTVENRVKTHVQPLPGKPLQNTNQIRIITANNVNRQNKPNNN